MLTSAWPGSSCTVQSFLGSETVVAHTDRLAYPVEQPGLRWFRDASGARGRGDRGGLGFMIRRDGRTCGPSGVPRHGLPCLARWHLAPRDHHAVRRISRRPDPSHRCAPLVAYEECRGPSNLLRAGRGVKGGYDTTEHLIASRRIAPRRLPFVENPSRSPSRK